uniref:Uncharacterized protein n=1 Tax=Babesia bovis TaxID=5865 RepID=S6B7A8_BABBO|nr:hypothetical protein [Babesia bovis]
MSDGYNVHVLPCLIKQPGDADIQGGFTDNIISLDSVSPETPLGGLSISDICGSVSRDVNFGVSGTERLSCDVYSSQYGSDPFLGKERLCTFLRGRCLRGSKLNFDAIGCRMSMVEVCNSTRQRNASSRSGLTPSYTLRELGPVESFTVWDRDSDISPLSPCLEGYKHIAVARALSDYSGERDYVEGYRPEAETSAASSPLPGQGAPH